MQDDDVIDWGAVKEQHEESQKARWARCPTLIKNFYREHPEVTEMTPENVKQFRLDNNNVVVSNFDPESSAPLLNPVPKYDKTIFSSQKIKGTRCCDFTIFLAFAKKVAAPYFLHN